MFIKKTNIFNQIFYRRLKVNPIIRCLDISTLFDNKILKIGFFNIITIN